MSRGRMSATWTSMPLGSSTSAGPSCTRHTDAENVSGMTLRIARGNDRSLRISLPFPESTTVTPAGCCRTVRPGGTPTESRMAKLCDSGCSAATATYSITAKNPAASLIGQLRTRSCTRLARLLIEQPPDEGFVHRAIPFRCTDHLLDDHAVAVDHPALGHPCGLVRPLDGSALVVQDIEGEPELTRERRHHRVAVLVDAHGHHAEVGPGQTAVQALERRHFDPAGLAPGRPDVQQHDLPAIVRERHGPASPQVLGAELRGGGADAHEIDLRADLDDERRPEDERHRHADPDCPPPRGAHTGTSQRRRDAWPSPAGSLPGE